MLALLVPQVGRKPAHQGLTPGTRPLQPPICGIAGRPHSTAVEGGKGGAWGHSSLHREGDAASLRNPVATTYISAVLAAAGALGTIAAKPPAWIARGRRAPCRDCQLCGHRARWL